MISLMPTKLSLKWPDDQALALEVELRSLTGKLLHVCQIRSAGQVFVSRMLHHAVGTQAVEGQPNDAPGP